MYKMGRKGLVWIADGSQESQLLFFWVLYVHRSVFNPPIIIRLYSFDLFYVLKIPVFSRGGKTPEHHK